MPIARRPNMMEFKRVSYFLCHGQIVYEVRIVSFWPVTYTKNFHDGPTGKWCFLRNSNNRRTVNYARQKLLGLVEMTTGLVNASFSLPERQAVKMIFFAPCQYWRISVIWQAENRQYNGFFWGKLACNKFETFQWQRQYCHYGYGGNRKFSLTEWIWHFKNQEFTY